MKIIFKQSYSKIASCFILLMLVVAPLKGWSDYPCHQETRSEIVVAAKAFDKSDCQKYLGRDLLGKGYQPIQIIIKNHTNKAIVFSPDQLNLPTVQLVKLSHVQKHQQLEEAGDMALRPISFLDSF